MTDTQRYEAAQTLTAVVRETGLGPVLEFHLSPLTITAGPSR